jgi:carbon monoxide dehydrogenase subunit G
MIETQPAITIDADIHTVWDFARDIRRWAGLMPGMQDCTVIDDDNSLWVLKVGVGGLVRTVKVMVHVDQWDGPERVFFSYRLEGDPVKGGGSYRATEKGPRQTGVELQVRVEGSGPMAPMWEAMGRPLLPQLAKGFAAQLKAEIEKTGGASIGQTGAPERVPSGLAVIGSWLRRVWRNLFRRPGMDLKKEETR